MPYRHFKKIWTPLVMFHIYFFEDLATGDIYMKTKNTHRRLIWKRKNF